MLSNQAQRDQYKLFVFMPLQKEFDDVYLVIRDATREVTEKLGVPIGCLRADEIDKPGQITDQIVDAIREADLVIADLSGTDAYVMYELGVAHMLAKPVILISQDVAGSPFDVRALRMILYERTRLHKDLRTSLVASLRSIVAEGHLEDSVIPFGTSKALVHASTKIERSQVFISYSHADSDILKRVLVHLKPLEKQGIIDLWVDTRIKVGEKWQDRIKAALALATVAILLISADYLASDFIVDNELPPLLVAAEQEGTKIIPVIVKPSRFLRDKNLAVFQALNDPAHPVMKMNEVDREEQFVRLAEIVEFYHV